MCMSDETGISRVTPERRESDERMKEQVAEVIENMSKYTEQITDLVARIDAERENLRRILNGV